MNGGRGRPILAQGELCLGEQKMTHRLFGGDANALLEAFGGVSGLYESLWKSKDEPSDSNSVPAVSEDGRFLDCEDEKDSEVEDPEDDTFVPYADQCQGFEWVSEGCQRLH